MTQSMISDQMDLGGVHPNILEAIRSSGKTWLEILGELCDNSFDAGASRVDIEFHRGDKIVVTDDGNGCDDIERMLTLGDHYGQPTTSLGVYGVGLKDAACSLWGKLGIETVKGGVMRSAYVDWQGLVDSRSWRVPAPVETDAPPSVKGTKLTFLNVGKGSPRNHKRLVDDLSFTFAPALASGKTISIAILSRTPKLITAWQTPRMQHTQKGSFELQGRPVSFFVGVVPDGVKNERMGMTYRFRHRTIKTTLAGLGEFDTTRICGIVDLGRGWRLGRNKTEVVDAHLGELYREIYERCEGFLRFADDAARRHRKDDIEGRVSEQLRVLLRKEKRQKGDSHGSHGRGNGERARNPRTTQPDNGTGARRRGGLRMRFAPLSERVAEYDADAKIVKLNEDHPFIAAAREGGGNIKVLVMACVQEIVQHYCTIDRDKLFKRKQYTGYHDMFCDLLAEQAQCGPGDKVCTGA